MGGSTEKAESSQAASEQNGKFLPALCNVLGMLMLVAVVGLCAPLMLPPLAGYQVVNTASSSMSPEIPTGSVVYVKSADPSDIQEGDVIAYQADGGVAVSRVVANHAMLGELVTKGDADISDETEPVPYEEVLGRVETHVPRLGVFMSIYANSVGKVYLLLVVACGIMLNMLASRMRNAARKATAPRRWRRAARGALAAVLMVAFLGSAGVIAFVTWQYGVSDSVYNSAADAYRSRSGADNDGAVASKPPIQVDFEALCAKNPDVVGWIYCPGTAIDYPVLQGKTNDDYLHHDYAGDYNINGSIFVDAENTPGFMDGNTIVYGHHMNSGSMFAALENWADQAYYEEHPAMWLLTPTQNYRIELFSAHHANAYSTMYQIISEHGEDLAALLGEALVESDLDVNAQLDAELVRLATMRGVDLSQVQVDEDEPLVLLDSQSRYVMFSTCAYLFDNDRYVLHGKLVPVD